MRVTVNFFHPFPRRSTTQEILRKAIVTPEIPGVKVRDLYSLYPNFFVQVEEEQRVLLDTDVVVFQHPFYWYSCPALMKEWMDSVLEKGWAYGDGGDRLEGKYWLQVITTGGAAEAYHRDGQNEFTMTEFLRPFERTARLCGMRPLKPLIIHGAPKLSDGVRRDQSAGYRGFLEKLQKGELPVEYSSMTWKVENEFPRLS